MEFFFLLFGFAALLAISGAFSGGLDAEPPEDDENERFGTEGDDIMFSEGGEILRGLGGDDTLITSGDSTLLGGEGDDTLISFGGGALLNGGAGEDTFVINLLEVTEEGDLLDVNGQPVEPTVIDDFNPDEDRLVLDLRNSGLLPEGDEAVVLTGVVAPDGEGLMIQVNGVNVVQLSSYGGGDMQSALEDLVNLDDAIEIVGADFVFPSDGLGTPDGVEIIENPDGSLSFLITDDYTGGGELVGAAGSADILDLSQFSGNASLIEDDEGNIYLRIEGDDVEPTLLTNVTSVILGAGENVVNVGSVPGGFTVTATDGTNTISAWRGGLDVNLQGGTNTVYMADSGDLRVIVAGGENTIELDDGVSAEFTLVDGAQSNTIVNGMGTILAVEATGLEATMTEERGAVITWDTGRLEIATTDSLSVGAGAVVDGSARDIDIPLTVQAFAPDATVIGSNWHPDIMSGQGSFFGGGGDGNQITIFNVQDGGATAFGGNGNSVLTADLGDAVTSNFTGDLVMTGGPGQDAFVVVVNADTFTGDGGIARITDLEEGENAFLRIFYSEGGTEPVVTTEPDAEANEVRVFVNGTLVLIIENTSELLPGMLIPVTIPIPASGDGIVA